MTLHKRFYLSIALLCLAGWSLVAEDKLTLAEIIKKQAAEIGDAMIAGDFAKMADRTYPPAVKLNGGRKEFTKILEDGTKQMKKDGFELKAFKLGEPSEVVTIAKESYVVVTTTLEIASPKGRIRSKSFLIGISDDDGKNWTFVDGPGLSVKDTRKKLLPNFPEKLKLPKEEAPELLPNDK